MSTRRTLPFRQQWLALGLATISKHYYRRRVINFMESLEVRLGYPDLSTHRARQDFKEAIMRRARYMPKCVRRHLLGPDATPSSERRVLNALYAVFGKYRAERSRQLQARGYENARQAQGTPALEEIRDWLMGYGIEGIPNSASYNRVDRLREWRDDPVPEGGLEPDFQFVEILAQVLGL